MAVSHHMLKAATVVGTISASVFPQTVRDQGGYFHLKGGGTPNPFEIQFIGRLDPSAPWIILARIDAALSFGDESFNNEGLDGFTLISKAMPMLPEMAARVHALNAGGTVDVWMVE